MNKNKNRRWTEEDIKILTDNFDTRDLLEISKLLKRTKESVRTKSYKIGLKAGNEIKWSKEDDDYIIENFPTVFTHILAKHLDRTITAVSTRAYLLGVKKEVTVYAMYKGDSIIGVGTARELSEQLDIEINTVYSYCTPSRLATTINNDNRQFAIRLEADEDD